MPREQKQPACSAHQHTIIASRAFARASGNFAGCSCFLLDRPDTHRTDRTDGTRPKWIAFLRRKRQRRSVGRRVRNPSCDGFPGAGRRRQRRSAGTGECQRSQRLNQGPKRHRQCGEDAVASAACDQAGDAHHRCAAQRDTALAAPRFSACRRDEAAAGAVRVVACAAQHGTRRHQGE